MAARRGLCGPVVLLALGACGTQGGGTLTLDRAWDAFDASEPARACQLFEEVLAEMSPLDSRRRSLQLEHLRARCYLDPDAVEAALEGLPWLAAPHYRRLCSELLWAGAHDSAFRVLIQGRCAHPNDPNMDVFFDRFMEQWDPSSDLPGILFDF